ncbi:MAG: sugar-binding domain-containing protein [Acidimicrobiales bacterium]
MNYAPTRAGGPGTATPISSWLVQSSAIDTADGAVISSAQYRSVGWYIASARSTVMAVLLANGHFPDVLHSTNLRDTVDSTIFQVPWWYRSTFTLSGSGRTVLRLDGVIHKADLFVNGKLVADHEEVAGSYTVNTFDVTDLVRRGLNAIALRVYPGDRMHDLSIGWGDWNPSPPDNNMGVWRDVWILRSGDVRLDDPHVTSLLSASPVSAQLTVEVDALNGTDIPVVAQVTGTISGHGRPIRFTREISLQPGQTEHLRFIASDIPALVLSNPALWWPVGQGDQPLYDLECTATIAGALSDEVATSFGMRSVDSYIAPGGGRQFVINERPIQILGGGWCPDIFLRHNATRLSDEMTYAIGMGLNAIRLEGKLETPEFYDLADQLGLMVLPGWECCDKWESHAGTGGAPWDEHDYFVARRSMESEALLLRNHPSVIAFLIGSDFAPPPRLAQIYADALEAAEWNVPIVSSGASEWNNPSDADGPPSVTAATEVAGPSGMKMWPYDWVPPVYWYTRRDYRAVGILECSSGHSIPRLPSLEKMLSSDELEALWRDFDAKQLHSGPPSPFDNLAIFDRALATRYGDIVSLRDYVRKTQLANYEMVRAQFEAFGSRANADEPATGVIYWMLNNAWPSLNWHLYDYYLDTAAAYFGAKKANESLHVQYAYDTSEVLVVNHTTSALGPFHLVARIRDLSGEVKAQTDHEVAAVSPGKVVSLEPPERPEGISVTYFLELELSDPAGQRVSRNVYWLSRVPDVLDWDATFWQHTPTMSMADLTGLERLPTAEVRATSELFEADGRSSVVLTVRNVSSQAVPAVGLHASVVAGNPASPVVPVLWDDNDVTLFGDQSVVLTASFSTSLLGGAPSGVEIDGFNVSEPFVVL